jgi:two-component system LytT family response regulator
MRSALESAPLERIFVRQGSRILPIAVADVQRIAAAGDYAELHAKSGTYLLGVSLRDLVMRLDPARFLRVHRSHVVNLDCVDHIRPYDDRRLAIQLRDGTQVVASRAASELLRDLAR